MSTLVVSASAAHDILSASGFADPEAGEIQEIAERLDEIARSLITDHYLNRRGSQGRERSLPAKEVRQRLYADLEGIWIDLPGVSELPTVVYSRKRQYEGRFVQFTRAFAGLVADHVDTAIGKSDERLWRGLIRTMRTLQNKGGDRITPVSVKFRAYAKRTLEAEREAIAKVELDAMPPWMRALATARR